jgi:DNA-binding transcriptional ArsR family regulator
VPELNWRVIAEAEAAPQRLAILERMTTEPPDGAPGWSAVTIASALSEPLAKTSHHMRVLRDRGWLREVGQRRRRGAIQTFYVLARDVTAERS